MILLVQRNQNPISKFDLEVHYIGLKGEVNIYQAPNLIHRCQQYNEEDRDPRACQDDENQETP